MTGQPINLTVERLRRGMSVAQAAKDIGVAEHVLRYAEGGGRPVPANALKIADYYGVDVIVQWPPPPMERAA